MLCGVRFAMYARVRRKVGKAAAAAAAAVSAW